MAGTEYAAEVRIERLALADRLAGLTPEQWDSPSLCAGWRARDVLAHLVWLAEATVPGAVLRAGVTMVRHRCGPFAAMRPIALRLGRYPVEELLRRLRAAADGRFVMPGAPRIVALGEVVVHGLDITRPLGLPCPVPAERVATVLESYRYLGGLFGTGTRARQVRLVPVDMAAGPGPALGFGAGPEVRGTAAELLLAVTGRPLPAGTLTGAGRRLLLGEAEVPA